MHALGRLLLIAGVCSAVLAAAPLSARCDDEGEDWAAEAAEV